MEQQSERVYVPVQLTMNECGQMRPERIIWEDGRQFEIDRVSAVRPAYSAKAGGQGDRYTVFVRGKQRYLYFERSTHLSGDVIGRWFVVGEPRM